MCTSNNCSRFLYFYVFWTNSLYIFLSNKFVIFLICTCPFISCFTKYMFLHYLSIHDDAKWTILYVCWIKNSHTYARTHTAVVRILFVQTTYRVTSLTVQYLVWLTGEITAHGITLRHVHVMITPDMIRGDNVLNTMWPWLFSFWYDGYYQQ